MSENIYRKQRITASNETNIEAMVSKNVLAQLKHDPPKPGNGKPAAGVEASDLLSSMAKRLSLLEREMKQRQALLTQIQDENAALKSKLKVAEEEIARRALAALSHPTGTAGGADADSAANGSAVDATEKPLVAHLRAENVRLRGQLRYAWKQVTDMKAFLNDYGMVWKGEDEEGVGAAPLNLEELQAIPSSSSVGHAEGSLAHNGAGNSCSSSSTTAPASKPAGYILGGRPRSRGQVLAKHDNPQGQGESLTSSSNPPAPGGAPSRRVIGTLAPIPPRPPSSEPPTAPNLARQSSFTAAPGPTKPAAPAASAATAGHPDRSASHTGASTASSAAPPSQQPPSSHPAAPATSLVAPHSMSTPPASTFLPTALPPPRRSHNGGERLAPIMPSSNPASTVAGPSGSGSSSSSGRPDPSRANNAMPFTMPDLLVKVEELNQLAGDGVGQVVAGRGGDHVLATPEPVHLSVFSNGLQLHMQAPRYYSEASAQSIVRDILDGYFPSALKREFPDGVPIRVVDRTHEGLDAVLAPAGSPTRAGAGNVRSFNDLVDPHAAAAAASAPLTKGQFLAKLPNQVIRNGKVIGIKSEIAKLLGGADGKAGSSGSADGASKPNVSVVPSPLDPLLSTMQRNHVGPSLPPPSTEASATGASTSASSVAVAEEIATLQVRSEDGKATFIVKLKFDDNINSLRKCIDAHRAKGSGAAASHAYEIRTAFPARAYSDGYETLRQAGLTPNATLFLKAVQP